MVPTVVRVGAVMFVTAVTICCCDNNVLHLIALFSCAMMGVFLVGESQRSYYEVAPSDVWFPWTIVSTGYPLGECIFAAPLAAGRGATRGWTCVRISGSVESLGMSHMGTHLELYRLRLLFWRTHLQQVNSS